MARTSCMCSPTVKCSLHRIPKPAAAAPRVRSDNGLMRPQLSRGGSRKFDASSSSAVPTLRRSRSVGNIVPGEVARRALLLAARSSGSQKIRRRNFQLRPSRLSRVSTAADF